MTAPDGAEHMESQEKFMRNVISGTMRAMHVAEAEALEDWYGLDTGEQTSAALLDLLQVRVAERLSKLTHMTAHDAVAAPFLRDRILYRVECSGTCSRCGCRTMDRQCDLDIMNCCPKCIFDEPADRAASPGEEA